MTTRPAPVFGSASSFLFGSARKLWVDAALLAALGGVIFGLTRLAAEWTGALRPVFEIDLSPWVRPGHVDHAYGDNASILKPCEWDWRLPTVSKLSRDGLPIPEADEDDPSVPTNTPAISDLRGLFAFERE
jgi:hypothetical protein